MVFESLNQEDLMTDKIYLLEDLSVLGYGRYNTNFLLHLIWIKPLTYRYYFILYEFRGVK